jgi:hypothetical protein
MRYFFLLVSSLSILFALGCTSISEESRDIVNTSDTTENWTISEEFEVDNLIMYGKKNRMGFTKLNGDPNENFIAQTGALYLWKFWGKDNEFNGALKLSAKNKTGKELMLANINESDFKNIEKGIESHFKLAFPSPGIWKIEATFGNKKFDHIIVKVAAR